MRKLIFTVTLLFPLITVGQNRYFVYLKDKASSNFNIENPAEFLSQRAIDRRAVQSIPVTEKDLPVSNAYLAEIEGLGFEIRGKSKWLNAVLVDGPDNLYNDLSNLDFVTGIELNGDIRGDIYMGMAARKRSKFDQVEFDYGGSLTQIKMLEADSMHRAGITGEGVLIAVLDAGFPGTNTGSAFSHLRNNGKIIRTWDYVTNTSNVYKEHPHGSNVLSIIAGKIDGKLYGTAPDAEVALYITEDNSSESRQEEVFWVFAAEDADSLGVDIINSSLGYSEFDDPSTDYTYSAMDGNTTIISRAAEYAASVGIIVVIAAGNEGNKSWRYITAPSDGPKTIAVGAVNASENIAVFSSRGPSPDGRIKPDVSAMGFSTRLSSSDSNVSQGNGTSYAAPLIAGFMGGLKQEFPQLTAKELKEVLIKSADRYKSPDNTYGYGIPSYTRAKEIIHTEYLILSNECDCFEVTLTPNPVFSIGDIKLKVGNKELPVDTPVSLIDAAGRVVAQNLPYKDIKMSNFDAGVYIVNFTFKHQNYSKKIVLMR